MAIALGTRPDQIAELTRGVQLPFQRIDPDILEIIANGVERAGVTHRAGVCPFGRSAMLPSLTPQMRPNSWRARKFALASAIARRAIRAARLNGGVVRSLG